MSEDREVILRFDPTGGLYFRELRPKRKLCSKCTRIPLAFFTGPHIEAGFGFHPLFNRMLSNTGEDIATVYNAPVLDLSSPAVFEHYDFRKLTRSAVSGCHLCTLIRRSLEEGEKSSPTMTAENDDDQVILTHQTKEFPFIGTKWHGIIPFRQRGPRYSGLGSTTAIGLYLRFDIAPVPGKLATKTPKYL